RGSARKTVFYKLHEHSVETSRFVVWITWESREATPFTRPLPQHAIFTIWCGGPVEKSCIPCDEGRTRTQSVRDFLCVCCWKSVLARLRYRRSRNKHQSHSQANPDSRSFYMHFISTASKDCSTKGFFQSGEVPEIIVKWSSAEAPWNSRPDRGSSHTISVM